METYRYSDAYYASLREQGRQTVKQYKSSSLVPHPPQLLSLAVRLNHIASDGKGLGTRLDLFNIKYLWAGLNDARKWYYTLVV